MRLRPLQKTKKQDQTLTTSDFNNHKTDVEKPGLTGQKNVIDNNHNYFYEYRLGSLSSEAKDNQRKSMSIAKNKEILDSLYNPLKNVSAKNAEQVRNFEIQQKTFRVPKVSTTLFILYRLMIHQKVVYSTHLSSKR